MPKNRCAPVAELQLGLPPDTVGDMTVDGVRANRPYVHTDRMMAAPITASAARGGGAS